jgi:hypothetical protein
MRSSMTGGQLARRRACKRCHTWQVCPASACDHSGDGPRRLCAPRPPVVASTGPHWEVPPRSWSSLSVRRDRGPPDQLRAGTTQRRVDAMTRHMPVPIRCRWRFLSRRGAVSSPAPLASSTRSERGDQAGAEEEVDPTFASIALGSGCLSPAAWPVMTTATGEMGRATWCSRLRLVPSTGQPLWQEQQHAESCVCSTSAREEPGSWGRSTSGTV